MVLAIKATVICLVIIGQVVTRTLVDQNCIWNHDKDTCQDGYCCVRDEFLSTRSYCRMLGLAAAPCSTQPTDFECPCVPGYMCATDAEGHVTSLFGRCFAIQANTTAAPTTSSSTTTSTTPTSSTTTSSTTTTTTPTPTTTSSITTSTSTFTTPVITTTTELQTTSVATHTPIVTFSTTTTVTLLDNNIIAVRTKADLAETLAPATEQSSSASTGSDVVTQKATEKTHWHDSDGDPLNIIVPIG